MFHIATGTEQPETVPGRRQGLSLFLSADLAGSSSFKNKHPVTNAPVTDPRSNWGWPDVFGYFFDSFATSLLGEDAKIRLSLERHIPLRIWKLNGDEILFVAELENSAQLYAQTHAFYRTITQVHRSMKDDFGLGVKGCCWVAGFPIRNRAIHISASSAPHVVIDSNNQHDVNFGIGIAPLEDYIGIEIDKGFRLCGYSRPGRIICSIDIAYLLAKDTLASKPLRFFVVGWERMRGVYDEKPYPIIWIDFEKEGQSKEPISVLEEAETAHGRAFLRTDCVFSRQQIVDLFERYQAELGKLRITPYYNLNEMRNSNQSHVDIHNKCRGDSLNRLDIGFKK